ncbi:DUF1499 domain-containing protein [Vibrio sp. SNU_ST1]|uniref:DUF1499 domain-containing protein n=1 Tax=Vibrio sp. SNU_ST1 TaxID=3064001 RepID=UPI00272CFF97|nr:DUF1499 domain-containing protein [Vibrio sp. SNU_ST1]WKY58480.1 DUF1499 domain-containing protein [Vibrio sp. SNU_ST1]
MKKIVLLSTLLISLSGCSQGNQTMEDRTHAPCGNKPNCVSTQDTREQHNIAPFTLVDGVRLSQVQAVILQLPRTKAAVSKDNYLRIEFTSKIMRFVDDLELKIEGENLLVRSESRTGHSDFGVNRKRAEQLRANLKSEGLIK